MTTAEVKERIAEGKVNHTDVRVSRSYRDIIKKNVFSPFNMVLFLLGILLIICGEPISAVSATGIIIVNILLVGQNCKGYIGPLYSISSNCM